MIREREGSNINKGDEMKEGGMIERERERERKWRWSAGLLQPSYFLMFL